MCGVRWPSPRLSCVFFFFFNDTATTEIYTLSLHDALPILPQPRRASRRRWSGRPRPTSGDRKSTRLNSSHGSISYAVFCLKKEIISPIVEFIAKAHLALLTTRQLQDR